MSQPNQTKNLWVVFGHDLGGNGGTAVEGIFSSEPPALALEKALKAIYKDPGGKYASEWSGVWVEEFELDPLSNPSVEAYGK